MKSETKTTNRVDKDKKAQLAPEASNSRLRMTLKFLIVVLLFPVGFAAGSNYGLSSATSLNTIDGETMVVSGTPAQGLDLRPLWQAWSLLESKFVSTEDDPSGQEKVEGLIEGLADAYNDPYTQFFNAEELSRFNEAVEGSSFSGVGMEIGSTDDGLLRVVAPLKNTPAYKSGIKSGDIIMQIDETNALDISVDEAISLIRGPVDTTVSLTVAREGTRQPLIFEIIRQNIDIPVLQTKVQDDVFIIEVYTFSADLGDKFRDALKEYEASKSTGLIIDVRNNPGGYLQSAVELGSWFTDNNEILVREKSERSVTEKERLYRSKGYQLDKLSDYQVVVLVNRGSASASEILAGILQDYGQAVVVGENTFGKGSVQELIPLDNDSAIKITTARWLTPKGRSISEGGLEPDILIADNPDTIEIDEQLVKALNLFD